MKNNKSLGQHWLKDRLVLDSIVDFARVDNQFVLEIGPGLGTLTSALLRRAERVVAIEFDTNLANKLPAQFPGKNLQVINQDFLKFDLNSLPNNYSVVANLPYYITAPIISKLLLAGNKPQSITILIQKEVAERLAQKNGSSMLGLLVENWADVELGSIIGPEFFTPPPKVDSQIVRLQLKQPILETKILEAVLAIAKAGFNQKRKKIQTSLASSLGLNKAQTKQLLEKIKINPNARAQDLSLTDYYKIYQQTIL